MITSSLVLYHSPDEQVSRILQCIEDSIIDKVYVIDNSSSKNSDELCKKFPKAEYQTHENTGYGSSHNIAIQKTIEMGIEYHIVLNPDICFTSDTISQLLQYMDKNLDVGYILPNVVYPNGEIQYLCKLLPTPSDLIFRRFLPKTKYTVKKEDKYVLKHSGYNKIMNPPCLSGCFMFLRCSTLKENNLLFDDRFFMYFEDFDLIRRIHKVSKTIYYPEVTIIHAHAKESYKSKKMLFIHIKSAIKYFNKWGWIFDKERKIYNKQILQEIEDF